MNQAQEQTKGAQAKPNLEGVDRALDYLKSYITQQQAGFECMSREYNEIRDAYRDVSEKNAALHKTNAALRVGMRALAGKDPVPTGTVEAAQEVPQPKANPDKPLEERRGCVCGCGGVSVTILKEDELPDDLKAILAQIRGIQASL